MGSSGFGAPAERPSELCLWAVERGSPRLPPDGPARFVLWNRPASGNCASSAPGRPVLVLHGPRKLPRECNIDRGCWPAGVGRHNGGRTFAPFVLYGTQQG